MFKFFKKLRQKFLFQNKIGNYFLYAIGEIILVVIGIFIALQANEWNQKRKNNQITRTNTSLLIENLSKDVVLLETEISDIDTERIALNSFIERINGPLANLDTLIRITREEYRGRISIPRFANDDSYNTMVLSNEINLFDNELKKKLYSVYSLHERIAQSMENEFDKYLESRKTLVERYPSRATLYEGPIYEEVWKNIELSDIAGKILFVIQRKLVTYSQSYNRMKILKEQTIELIEDLKKSIDDA